MGAEKFVYCIRLSLFIYLAGIRAVLIDKDDNPSWNPQSLSEISVEEVEKYFSPLPAEEELIL